MWILITALAGLALIALAASYLTNRKAHRKGEAGQPAHTTPPVPPPVTECCGQHEVCERDSLLAAVSRKIEYYDDEELDRFAGKKADAYTEAETNEFREVLYTMQDFDVAGWMRSLQLRNVALPEELRDEVFLIVGELRGSRS